MGLAGHVSRIVQGSSDTVNSTLMKLVMTQHWLVPQVASQTELHQHAQKYNAQLQEYNGKLQDDMRAAAEQLQQLQAGSLSHPLAVP